MKALILALLLLPTLAHADVSIPRAKQYGWTTYDVSAAGGASTAHNLGLVLPSGAILTDVWVYINTQFAASGSESLALQCVGTRDIMAYQGMAAVPADRILAGRMLGNTFNGGASLLPANATVLNFGQGFGSIPSDCALTAVVRGDAGFTPYTAGKATVIVEYFRN